MKLHVGLARVSKEEQAFEQALKMQVERLQRAGCDRVYADIGSRDNDDRQGLQEVIKMVECEEVKSVTVVRLDRLTSSPGLFEKLSKLLQQKKVPLRVIDENVDIHSIDGEFAAGLQIYFSQRELKTIRMRVRKSYEHRRSKSQANTQTPWGYKNVKGKYQLDHTPYICLLSDRPECGEFSGRTVAELAKEMIDTFFEVGGSAGKTVKTIHKRYGILKFKQDKATSKLLVFDKDDEFDYKRHKGIRAGIFRWSPDGFRRWLKNPVLRGHTPYGTKDAQTGNKLPIEQWEIRYNTHPNERLLTEERYLAATEAIALNKRIGGFAHKNELNTFIGILTCAVCGRNMRCQTIKASGEKYYQCRSYAEDGTCTAKKMVRESVVMNAVVKALVEKHQSIAQIATAPDEIIEPPHIQQLHKQIEGLKNLGDNPAFDEAIQKIQGQIDKWRIEQESSKRVDAENLNLLAWACADPDFWTTTLTKKDVQQVIRALVKEVKSEGGKVSAIALNL